MTALHWHGVVAVEAETTEGDDARQLDAGALTWPAPPLPMLHRDPDLGMAICGSVLQVWREGNDVMASGRYTGTVHKVGDVAGVAIDVIPRDAEMVGPQNAQVVLVHEAELRALSLTELPAWSRSRITFTDKPPR